MHRDVRQVTKNHIELATLIPEKVIIIIIIIIAMLVLTKSKTDYVTFVIPF